MLISVPQYIDVEDKIVGPVTAKQLGWLVLMGITLLVLWNTMPRVGFFLVGIPLGLMFLAFAFYKPYGQPLGSFILFGIMYFFKPKVYVWKRDPQIAAPKKQEQAKQGVHTEKKLTSQQIQGLANLLDSEGRQRDENIVSLLKEQKKR
jgi:hypothetical protein